MYKTEVVCKERSYNLEDSLLEFNAWLKEQIDKIPKEYLDSATIEIESWVEYDTPSTELIITYDRPETKEEVLIREKKESTHRREMRLKELEQLAMLKKKYERVNS